MSDHRKNMSFLLTMDLENADVLSVVPDWYEMLDAVHDVVYFNNNMYGLSENTMAIVAALLVRNHA